MILNKDNIEKYVDQRKCAKQTTIAIIVKNGMAWIGSNWCFAPQEQCPRAGLPTGVGYELCEIECNQYAHAEVDACLKSGYQDGATLYLIGHTYCCNKCLDVARRNGIDKVVIGEFPKEDLEIVF